MIRCAHRVEPPLGFWLLMLLVVSHASGGFAFAQAAIVSNQPPSTALMPPLPSTRSPVDVFRELLAMTPGERNEFLSTRSPENRRMLLAKVGEYKSLTPNECAWRLRVTELRWYLLPLMQVPSTNRAVQLANLPVDLRPMIEDRLRKWDELDPQLQQEVWQNELAVRYFTEGGEQTAQFEKLSPERRIQLDLAIQRWQALSEEQRQKILAQVGGFFKLNSDEKEKTLTTLSEPERKQLEKTLANFASLTPAQRDQCVKSFQKLNNLTPEERRQFLKNAERWSQMSPDEREAWKNLVKRLPPPPPLPPGLQFPPSPPEPRRSPRALATNGQ